MVSTRRRSSRLASAASNRSVSSVSNAACVPTLAAVGEEDASANAVKSNGHDSNPLMPGGFETTDTFPPSVNVRSSRSKTRSTPTPTPEPRATNIDQATSLGALKSSNATAAIAQDTKPAIPVKEVHIDSNSQEEVKQAVIINANVSRPSAAFQFTFRHGSLELSEDAKKIMAESRGEAARIRDELAAQVQHTESTVTRKTLTPKGRSGRFSDVHNQQFNKMTSIAGHASAFRANKARLQPTSPAPKRRHEPVTSEDDQKAQSANKVTLNVGRESPDHTGQRSQKRVKREIGGNTGVAPSTSPGHRVGSSSLSKPSGSSRQPTQASIARGTLDKGSKLSVRLVNSPSKIGQGIKRKTSSVASASPSKSLTLNHPLSSPGKGYLALTKTTSAKYPDLTPRYTLGPSEAAAPSSLPKALPVKSILKTPQRLYSSDPAKIAAGTHIATPTGRISGSRLPQAPATAPVKKHVGFSSSTIERADQTEERARFERGGKWLHRAPPVADDDAVIYPSLDVHLPNNEEAVPESPTAMSKEPMRRPLAPPSYDFTFRHDGPIKFGAAAIATTNEPMANTNSNTPAHSRIPRTPTQTSLLPVTTCGATTSKKRKFVEEDEQTTAVDPVENKENSDFSDAAQRSAKRVKPSFSAATASSTIAASPRKLPITTSRSAPNTPLGGSAARRLQMKMKKNDDGGKGQTPARKRVVGVGAGGTATTGLSMARLNMLATPKRRV